MQVLFSPRNHVHKSNHKNNEMMLTKALVELDLAVTNVYYIHTYIRTW